MDTDTEYALNYLRVELESLDVETRQRLINGIQKSEGIWEVRTIEVMVAELARFVLVMFEECAKKNGTQMNELAGAIRKELDERGERI